jgi:BirA family biotin operon repressor/biotin-[acetyl-CoA-carboxylase] ligase
VKWPNDVWIDGRKVAGVLIESRAGADGWAVIGIGLNLAIPLEVFPRDLAQTATSLAGIGIREGRDAVNESLARWVDAPADRILEAYRRRDALSGRAVSWNGGEGKVAGIDGRGHLLVDTASGQVALGAGEVHLALPGRD